MKAVKLIIGFILFSLACSGQTPTGPLPVKTWFEYQKFNVKISFVPPRDTLSTADSGAIATKGNTVYVKNGKWRPVADTNAVIGSDTFYLRHVGTSASQINTMFVYHGVLVASRWGGGFGWTPFLAGDSLASGAVDSTVIASKAWVIAHYGIGVGTNSFFGKDDILANEDRTFDYSGKTFRMMSKNGGEWSVSMSGDNLGDSTFIQMFPASPNNIMIFGSRSGTGHYGVVAVDPTGIAFGNDLGIYSFNAVPVFANNAAAITGGLGVGRVYQTSTGSLQIVF